MKTIIGNGKLAGSIDQKWLDWGYRSKCAGEVGDSGWKAGCLN